jgi:hypothetical protein
VTAGESWQPLSFREHFDHDMPALLAYVDRLVAAAEVGIERRARRRPGGEDPTRSDDLNAYYDWGRVGWNDDGSLDEIVVNTGGVHIEQMDVGAWAVMCDSPQITATIWLHSPRPGSTEDGDDDPDAIPITATWEIGDPVTGAAPVEVDPGERPLVQAVLALSEKVGRLTFLLKEAEHQRDQARLQAAGDAGAAAGTIDTLIDERDAARAAVARVRAWANGPELEGSCCTGEVYSQAQGDCLAALAPPDPGAGT